MNTIDNWLEEITLQNDGSYYHKLLSHLQNELNNEINNSFTLMYIHPIARKKGNRETEMCKYSLYLTNRFLLSVSRSFPLYLALVSQVLSFLAFLLILPGRYNYKVY